MLASASEEIKAIYPAQHLKIISEAVALLREERLSSGKLLDDILTAAHALELLASTGRAGCSAAESAVSHWTSGHVNEQYDAGYDVLSGNGSKLEVKYSKLNQPNKISQNMRWNWTNILGNLYYFRKSYDYLILVGQADERFFSEYPTIDSRYVVFSIPRSYIENRRAEIRLSPAARGTIALSTDPNLAHTLNDRTICEIGGRFASRLAARQELR